MTDYTATDAGVFIRGVFHTPDSCDRLLAIFRREAAEPGWWGPYAAELADQLEAAIRAANQIQHERAAA